MASGAARLLQRKAQIEMGIDIIGTELDSLFVMGDGLFLFAQADQDGAEVVVRFGGGGGETERLLEVSGRLWCFSRSEQGLSQIDVRSDVVGVDAQRLLVMVDGVRDAARLQEGVAQVVMRLGVIGQEGACACWYWARASSIRPIRSRAMPRLQWLRGNRD